MKTPKPRKLSSGNYFIQLRLDGESIPITARTERECIASARLVKAEYLAGKREKKPKEETLKQIIDAYISSRSNTLSPSTLRGYYAIRDNRFKNVINKRISEIRDWQQICNEEAGLCSPKTLKNAWRFVASAIRSDEYPVPHIKLPQVIIKEAAYLEPEQIPAFIAAVKGSACEIPALLALHSLRRSEICALTWENIDLNNRRILVSGAAVFGSDNKLVIKQSNKNRSSHRYVPIMIHDLYDALALLDRKEGLLFESNPNTLWAQINRVCAANGLPKIGVHGLRHSFASLAYHLSIPEMVAMQIGGWADFGTMRKIYTHLAQKDVNKYTEELSDFFNPSSANT